MRHTGLLAALLLSSSPGIARPDEAVLPPPVIVAVPPVDAALARRGVQIPAGLLGVGILVNASLNAGAPFAPVSVVPDVAYGVSDDLQVGIRHSGPMGWQTPPGGALCVTGKEDRCGNKVYNNVGLDGLYALLRTRPAQISAHGTLYFDPLDPFTIALNLGAAGKLRITDDLAVWLDPQLRIGINRRDAPSGRTGNRERIFLPIELQVQVTPALAAIFQTGLDAPVAGFAGQYRWPVGVAALYAVDDAIDLGVRLAFENVGGAQPLGIGRLEARTISTLVNLRL
jgi:hypothetical protein